MSKPAVRDIVREYLHAHRRRPVLDAGGQPCDAARGCTFRPEDGAATAERAPIPRRMDGAHGRHWVARLFARSGFAARSSDTFSRWRFLVGAVDPAVSP